MLLPAYFGFPFSAVAYGPEVFNTSAQAAHYHTNLLILCLPFTLADGRTYITRATFLQNLLV
jgi:hypothetical protein